jgi:hypothetical protein
MIRDRNHYRHASNCRLFFLSVVLVVCAGSNDGTAPDSGVGYDQIDVTELLDSVDDMNAFQLVRLRKPEWIGNRRGQASYSRVQVYLDGSDTPFGTVFSLKSLSASQVRSIERLTAVEAQHRFGDGNAAGALLVRTRSGDAGS